MRTESGKTRWVIVAHPDDEIIFAGGAILSHRAARWKVVIATHNEQSERAAESLAARDAIRALGVDIDYVFLSHTDDEWHPTGGIKSSRMERQLQSLGITQGDRVYTHGAPGEYGHNGHKAVHAITTRVLDQTALVSTFSGGADVLEQIDDAATLKRKAELFDRAYPSQSPGLWKLLAHVMDDVMTCERHFRS